jgi:molecular chaperone GrpE
VSEQDTATETQPPETPPEAESVATDGDVDLDADPGDADPGLNEESAAEQVISDLDRLQMERNDYLDQLLRTRADFDNYRKRMIKQQSEQLERAAGNLVEKLLGVLDVLDGATSHGEGFEQVGTHLVATLQKEGLERIDPMGRPFDPNEADAVAHEDGDGGPVVSAVLRPGYRWKGRLLRPAMVKVRG